MNNFEKFKTQLKENQENIKKQEPKSNIEEAKSFCEALEDIVKETKRQLSLEEHYTDITRQVNLKSDELYNKILKIDGIKLMTDDKITSDIVIKYNKLISEYDLLYNELLLLIEEQNKYYEMISKYRDITEEQRQLGFLK